MEKITVKLKCPKCGNNLSALVNQGMNIATAQVRCSNSICKYVGKGSEFLVNNNPPKNVVADNTIPNKDNTEELVWPVKEYCNRHGTNPHYFER